MSILTDWQQGRGLPGILVIDGHVHFDAGMCGEGWETVEDAAAYSLQVLDANGVDAACILGGGFYGPGNDYTLGNDDLYAYCQIAPERFIGFACYNPNDDAAALDAELRRTWEMGFRCMKLINTYQQHYPGDGPNMMRIYRFAAEHNMLLLNHYWPPDELARLATAFPSLNFIAGHWYANEVLRLPNVYCNIWGLLPLGALERGVREYGADKFLYGSDAFLNPISVGIGLVVHADLPDDDKRKILGLNQARLLEQAGALPAACRAAAGR